ncbi:hypothetical protein M3Y99_01661500 [Aphelenchoides fujianensis]|nr:hypothetical protein M3Y99_01661500 [Aphelenchoides fujianensis]
MWGLSEYQNQPSFMAHVRQALVNIAASLSPREREELCYSLPELVSSCSIGDTPCDMDDDFERVFDVDYGFCYTFNPKEPSGVYESARSGSTLGLRMVLFTNPITYLHSTESKGFKIVPHAQDYAPFPNTEGYFGAVGESIRFVLDENRYTRLGSPYNECDDLDSLEDREQPFYYDGEYSIEGCFRSCFQQKLFERCGCADSRFPFEKDGRFCSPTNRTEYECNQAYIRDLGDYYFVNCTCQNACNQTAYSANIWRSRWPTAPFFYELYCPSAELNNSAEILVYYSRLMFTELLERPQQKFVDLLSGMGGTTSLWVGCTAITVGELLLMLVQAALWCFRCKKELPEVPSCRHFDYENEERGAIANKEFAFAEFHVLYKQILPMHSDHVPPPPVGPALAAPFYVD